MSYIKIFFLSLFLFKFTLSSLKFNIPQYRDKCFQEEIYVEGTILVRYDLYGVDAFIERDRLRENFRNIKVFIKDTKGNIIFERYLDRKKDKFAVLIKQYKLYFIKSSFNRK